ncbi:PEP-CTERM protein-sorting domain-containing protein [Prauserella halophila]|nr:PEP-CTERM protein-sorting domain-containing protein [Prauserella halophila]
MAPEASGTTAGVFGPVRLVGEAAARVLHGQGWRIRVLSSYSVSVGQGSAELHSLADVVEFVCAQCLEWCEATLVAIRRRYLVCPGCFGEQPQSLAPEPATIPASTAGVSMAGARRAPWSVHAARPCRRERT